MYVYMYVCMYVCMYVYMYVCMYVCMYICIYVCIYVYAMTDYSYIFTHRFYLTWPVSIMLIGYIMRLLIHTY